MALLFFDNFGGYATADISYTWVAGGGTIAQTGGRNSGPMITFTGNNANVTTLPFAATSTLVIGFAMKITTGSVSYPGIIRIYDAGTTQVSLTLNADRTLSVVRGSATAVTGGTSVLGLSIGTWYYVEMKVTIADSISAGTCEVRVNGTTWITVATGQDLKATSNSTANQVSLHANYLTPNISFTDFYVDNGTTFLGDCTVSTLTVSGAGTTNTLTTGTSADVDDTTNDGDSTYAESAVNGQLATFAMTNLSVTPTTIHAVAPWNLIRKTDGGLKTARSVIRSGGANYGQADFNATDSYLFNAPITIVDPATAVAWVAAGVNAIEAGFEVRS